MALKKKKSLSWKPIVITLALVLGLGGYITYKNMVATPSINLADGLEAEEAAFLQKSINTDKKGSVGTAPAPVVKVTEVVTRPKQDNPEEEETIEVTGTVTLNNTAAKTVAAAKAAIVKQLVKTGIPTKAGQPIGMSGTAAVGSGASGTTGSGTCATNGSPVLIGTWVSTGTVYTPKPGEQNDGQGRTCMKCTGGGKNGYEGTMDCRDVFIQQLPMVIPTGGGVAYTGTVGKDLSSCYVEEGATWVQVPIGYSNGSNICAPDGKIKDKNLAQFDLDEYCKTWAGYKFIGGKCQDPGSSGVSNPSAGRAEPKCNAPKPDDPETWIKCDKEGKIIEEKKCDASSGAAFDKDGNCRSAAAVASDNKFFANVSYKTSAECTKAAGTTGKCITIQGGGFGIVPKNSNITGISYNSGSTAGRPTSFTGGLSDTTYTTPQQCQTAKRAGEECVPVTGGSGGTGSNGYKISLPYKTYTFGGGNFSAELNNNQSSGAIITNTTKGSLAGAVRTDDAANCEFDGALVAPGVYKCYCDANQINFTNCSPNQPAQPSGKKKAGESCSITGSWFLGGIPNLNACENDCKFSSGWYCADESGKVPSKSQITPPTTIITNATMGSLPGETRTNNSENCEFGGVLVAPGVYRCYCDTSQVKFTNCNAQTVITAQPNEIKSEFDRPAGVASYRNEKGLYYNGASCNGKNNLCVSNYCEKNTLVGIDWLAVDRCSDPKPPKAVIQKIEQNPLGQEGGIVDDLSKCRYEGGYLQIGGGLVCPLGQ